MSLGFKGVRGFMKHLLLIFSVFLIFGCSTNNNPSNRKVEELIVYMDTNKMPEPGDTKVVQMASLLDYLVENTTSSRKEIGDITTATVDLIKKKYNKTYTHQQILEGGKRLIDSVPPEKRGKKENFQTYAFTISLEASAK